MLKYSPHPSLKKNERSFSSGLTRTHSNSNNLLSKSKQKNKHLSSGLLKNPFPNNYPLRFPKKLVHTRTKMNLYKQTEELDRKYCLKANYNAHRATVDDDCFRRNIFRHGECGFLARESPLKVIKERDYDDIGVTNNRKRTFISHNTSLAIFPICEETTPKKSTFHEGKKQYNKPTHIQSLLVWAQNQNHSIKEKFKAKHQRPQTQINQTKVGLSEKWREKHTNVVTSSPTLSHSKSYAEIHLRTHKNR